MESKWASQEGVCEMVHYASNHWKLVSLCVSVTATRAHKNRQLEKECVTTKQGGISHQY